MIIGINGYAGTGKDTIGTIIQYLTDEYAQKDKITYQEWFGEALDITSRNDHSYYTASSWEIKKWAGKLKFIASILTGIDEEKFEDQEFKKANLDTQWDCNPPGKVGTVHRQPMTVRDFLQKLGTDAIRDGLHTNAWVNALMADYQPISDQSYVLDDGTYFDLRKLPGHPLYPNWIITDTRFPNEAQAIKDAGGIVIRVDRPGVSAVNAHPSETALDNWDFDHKIMNGSDITALSFTIQTILDKYL